MEETKIPPETENMYEKRRVIYIYIYLFTPEIWEIGWSKPLSSGRKLILTQVSLAAANLSLKPVAGMALAHFQVT
jgi:hypothetical protein